MNDIFSSIRAAISDRVTSPLAGTLAVFWALCNFEVLLIIFGEGPFNDKIAAFTQYFNRTETIDYGWLGTWDIVIFENIIFPVFLTIIYLTIYQFLAWVALWVNLKTRKKFIDTKKKYEEDRWHSAEAFLLLEGQLQGKLKEIRDLNNGHANELDSIKNEKDNLLSVLEKKGSEYNKLQSEMEVIVPKYEELSDNFTKAQAALSESQSLLGNLKSYFGIEPEQIIKEISKDGTHSLLSEMKVELKEKEGVISQLQNKVVNLETKLEKLFPDKSKQVEYSKLKQLLEALITPEGDICDVYMHNLPSIWKLNKVKAARLIDELLKSNYISTDGARLNITQDGIDLLLKSDYFKDPV